MGELKITKTHMDIPDPLVLHNSDHTGIVVVSKSLDEHSYTMELCYVYWP
jgi:protein tyrosine phosphatase